MKTIQIITKNNENTITNCLQSICKLKMPIIIADLESTDKTLSICKQYTNNIKIFNKKNRSEIRNEISVEENIYIEPWEELIYEEENLDKNCYYCRIINNNFITKEIRIWQNKLKFINPIYEYINSKEKNFSKLIFISNYSPEYDIKEIQKWKEENLLQSDPYYYECLNYLKNKKYKDFILAAENYLFKEKEKKVSITMLRYYLAMIESLINKNYNIALKHLTYCLSENILMAEFWCLLGDIHLEIKDYKKAKEFYENAIILGNKRLEFDEWPLQINKYEEYPKNMLSLLSK